MPGLVAYGGLAVVGAALAYRKAKVNNVAAQQGRRFQIRPGQRAGGTEWMGPALFAGQSQVGVTWLKVAF